MRTNLHPLTLQVQELFLDSNLTPKVNLMLLKGIDDYFQQQTIACSNNMPQLVDKLYLIGDNEMYTIISTCNHSGYHAALMPAIQGIIRSSAKDTIKYIKESGEYQKEDLSKVIKDVNVLMKSVLLVLRDSTRTTRRAIGTTDFKEVEFPDYETLKVFYECERKVRYGSVEEGNAGMIAGNNIYLCPHCSGYHQGQARVAGAPEVPLNVQLGRYKTAWRRYNNV